jgi:hypothetical protein
MPDVSQKQRGAMFAAKAGNSRLGIPPKVGADFVAADKAAGNPRLPKKAPAKPGGSKVKAGPEHAKKLAIVLMAPRGGAPPARPGAMPPPPRGMR